MQVRVDDRGLVQLTWTPGVRVTGDDAAEAMRRVDELNGTLRRPMVVDMAGTTALTRDARTAFSRRCSASKIALLGQSAVDRVIANFALGVSKVPVPTRFFTSRVAAEQWLLHDTDG
jgi:hypothetical protein